MLDFPGEAEGRILGAMDAYQSLEGPRRTNLGRVPSIPDEYCALVVPPSFPHVAAGVPSGQPARGSSEYSWESNFLEPPKFSPPCASVFP